MHRSNELRAMALLLGVAAAPAANAGLMPAFTGWTEMNDCPPCDGTVIWYVYGNTDGNWLDDPLFAAFAPMVLAGSVSGAEVYVYLYQVVNTDNNDPAGFPPEAEIGQLQIRNRAAGSLFGGGGYFGAVLDDGTPVLGDANGNFTLAADDYAGNNYPVLGSAVVGDDTAPDLFPSGERDGGNANPSLSGPLGPDAPSDGIPSRNGITAVGLSASTGAAVAPSQLELSFIPVPALFAAPSDTVVSFFREDGIPVGDTSLLLFLTSEHGPAYDFGSPRSFAGPSGGSCTWFEDAQGCIFPGAGGDLPTAAAPLPGTLALLGAGLAGRGVGRRRRAG
jgi:hypothetical protein